MSQGETQATVDTSLTAAARAFEALDSEPENPTPQALPTKAKAAKPAPESPSEDVDETSDDTEPADDAEPTDDDTSDADDIDDGDAEEEQSEDEEAPPRRKHRVKVDGDELEVDEDELVKGYSRTADYTRKSQKLAEERKAFQSEAQAVRDERKAYAERLESLATAIRAVTPQEPDWDRVATEAPEEFPGLYAQWQVHKERLAAIEGEQQRTQQQLAADHEKALKEFVDNERKALVEKLPAFKDAKSAQKVRAEMEAYAKTQGLTSEELAGIADHRALVLLHKAMLFDRSQREVPNVVKQVEKLVAQKPGSAKTQRPPVSDVTRSKQRLAKTGKVADAAALFDLMG